MPPGESYRKLTQVFVVFMCDVFRALINSFVCDFANADAEVLLRTRAFGGGGGGGGEKEDLSERSKRSSNKARNERFKELHQKHMPQN